MRAAKLPASWMRKMVLTSFLSLVDVCDSAPSCWSVNGYCLKWFLASARAGVKIASMYELVLRVAARGTETREGLHVLETATHVMTADDFWRMKTLRMESEMSTEDLTRIRPFCQLNTASTLNTFSSEKIISPASVPDFIWFRKIFARTNLFSFWRFVRW